MWCSSVHGGLPYCVRIVGRLLFLLSADERVSSEIAKQKLREMIASLLMITCLLWRGLEAVAGILEAQLVLGNLERCKYYIGAYLKEA